MPRFDRPATAAALACCLIGSAHALPERVSPTAEDALARLGAATGGALQHRGAPGSAYTLLRATGALPLLADGADGRPLERAQAFMSLYGAAAGVTDPAAQLALQRISTDAGGNTHVHLDQIHRGLPVFGARLVVHMNGRGITGVSGAFIRGLDPLPTEPTLDVAAARRAALSAMAKQYPGAALQVTEGRWLVYPAGVLMGRQRDSRLAYAAVVSGLPARAVREQVLVDAHTGAMLNHFSLIHATKNREIYTPDMTLPPVLTEGSPLAPADIPLIDDPGHGSTALSTRATRQPTDNLYIFAGGTYDLYANLFDRQGYDACDGDGPCTLPADQVQRSVYLVNEACPNAYWDGTATNYCPGFDADDVVSHEWSHAYTQFTHGLIYQYQSGALNESYSDIFGETYDLVNGIEGPLGATLTEHEYYVDGGSRWVMGEDLSEAAAALLLRDMWDPDAFPSPSPGSVISENYACGTGDGGGVHTNSGVPNHSFAMLVDGKTFNDVTVPGIGLLKAAHIYFQAETHYQTPTSNFAAHADALRAACDDLVGVNLRGIVDGAPSGISISAADCEAVLATVTATGMYETPACHYVPVLNPEASTPPACGDNEGSALYTEDWEGGTMPAEWTLTTTGVNPATWRGANWAVSSDVPLPHGGTAAFAVNDGAGDCAADDNSGHFSMDSPEFTIAETDLRLTFAHFMQSEAAYDGGNLKYSINGAAYELVPEAAFTWNGHSSTFAGPPPGGQNTSPLAGEAGWSGSDQGGATGSWGKTIVNVSALGVAAGDKIRFRFDFGQDGCSGNLGWFVDEVKLLSCPAPPLLSVGSDYEDPDTDGSFTLNWTRPAGATGPDLVQESTLCAAAFSDNADEALVAGANTLWEGSAQWTSSTNPGDGSSAYYIADTNLQNESLTLVTPIAIPAGASSTLRFTTTYGLELNYDFGYVEVSTDGTNWMQVDALNGPAGLGATPLDTVDATRTVDLSAYADQSVMLRFRLTSDLYNEGAPAGWYIDNIEVVNSLWNDVATPAAATATLSGRATGSYCYRARTAFPGAGGALVNSPFSNVVNIDVDAVANLLPIANAGLDDTVDEGAGVLLSGAGSSDPENGVLTYAWNQLSGPTVVLSGANTATPAFTAPEVAMATPLEFELTVTDAGGLSDTDTVEITVNDVPVPPPGGGTPSSAIGNNSVGGALAPWSLLLLAGAALRRRARGRQISGVGDLKC